MSLDAKHRLVFVGRLPATLVHLRHGRHADVPACWFDVGRSTVTPAIGEVRPLLAERGPTVSLDVRLRTLAEVVDHLGVTGTAGTIDGTEIRVRRPAVGRTHRDSFISGKSERNAVRTAVFTDEDGQALYLPSDQAVKLRGHHPHPPVLLGDDLDLLRVPSGS
ncbi:MULTISPECIES: transposase family protein [unclassified Streptomyces]|uniref:transposase family protein n=1 Tax=unclassified Streptomyces TaxID=2593676 RepID=UPI0037196653